MALLSPGVILWDFMVFPDNLWLYTAGKFGDLCPGTMWEAHGPQIHLIVNMAQTGQAVSFPIS